MHLLIFDLDGTLVDSKQDLIDAVNATRGYMDLAPLPGPKVASYVGRGAKALIQSALGDSAPAEEVDRAHTFFLKYYGEHMLDKTVLYDGVREALKQVIDPELFVNVIDLGLIYLVALSESAEKTNVTIEMTMTSPACPAGPQLIAQAKKVVGDIEGAGNVEVKLVMTPPWTPDRMTEAARDQLGIF